MLKTVTQQNHTHDAHVGLKNHDCHEKTMKVGRSVFNNN